MGTIIDQDIAPVMNIFSRVGKSKTKPKSKSMKCLGMARTWSKDDKRPSQEIEQHLPASIINF